MSHFRRPCSLSALAGKALVTGLVAATLLTALTGTDAHAAGFDDDSEPQVAAIATSGLVRISTEWSGYVHYDTAAGPVRSDQVVATVPCSGFAVDSTGHVVTAGSCVDPQHGRTALIHRLVESLSANGTLTDAEVVALTPHALQSWAAEGATAGAPIARRVLVRPPTTGAGVAPAADIAASVLDVRSIDQGDVALLAVPARMPALRLARDGAAVGARMAVVGYPTSADTAIDSAALNPTFTTGRISAVQTPAGLSYLQIDAGVAGMSGAPVVDRFGDVVAMVSASPLPSTQGFTFAIAAEPIGALLRRNGVESGLTESDRLFRAGVSEYYDGDLAAAVASFDEVLTAVPQHAVAEDLRSSAARSLTDHAAERAANTKSASKASGAAVAAVALPATDESSFELPPVLWCGGALLLLLAVAGAAGMGVRQLAGRARPLRVANPIELETVAASGVSAGARPDIAQRNSAGSRPGAGSRTNATRWAAPSTRHIPLEMMSTTVPADLMRTTVSADLMRTTVLR